MVGNRLDQIVGLPCHHIVNPLGQGGVVDRVDQVIRRGRRSGVDEDPNIDDEQLVLFLLFGKGAVPGPDLDTGEIDAIGHESAGVISAPKGGDGSARTDQAASAGADEDLAEIKSPIVGTLYATPSPDSENYVEVGSRVEPQTVVCIIEAMKVMNEIKAEISGTIREILVSNGQAVEYGQVLFRVKAD